MYTSELPITELTEANILIFRDSIKLKMALVPETEKCNKQLASAKLRESFIRSIKALEGNKIIITINLLEMIVAFFTINKVTFKYFQGKLVKF